MDPRVTELLDRYETRLGATSAAFARRVYSKGIAGYEERLRQYGFFGRAAVLDAGCGFGQWSLALAQMNVHVDACDLSPERVDFCADVARAMGADNVRVTRQDLTSLDQDDGAFDAVFCYGGLPLTPWRTALTELTRVLQPGGLLYVNANGFGWYKNLWLTEPNKSADYIPRLVAARAMLNSCRYDQGEPYEAGAEVIVAPADVRAFLESRGFEDIVEAEEGCLGATDLDRARKRSFFKGHYGGDLGVYEVIARKRRS